VMARNKTIPLFSLLLHTLDDTNPSVRDALKKNHALDASMPRRIFHKL
jgi:hypothetical protein